MISYKTHSLAMRAFIQQKQVLGDSCVAGKAPGTGEGEIPQRLAGETVTQNRMDNSLIPAGVRSPCVEEKEV